jgi:bifunctional DNase/RNase
VTALRDIRAARLTLDVPRWLLLLGVGLAAACSRAPVADVEVEVTRIALDPDARSPVVLLEDKAHTVALPIWIGPSEAHAIASRLEGFESPRPLTHDLMKSLMERLGVGLKRVIIRELRESTYYATLVLLLNGEEVEIDSRPSDAIALAVRFGQPIFVNRALLESEAAVELRGARGNALTVEGVTIQRLSADLADFFALPIGNGVVVSDVSTGAGSPLHRGDVVLEVDGSPIRDPADFETKVRAHGGRAELSVQRDGARIHVAFAPAQVDRD